MDAADLLLVVFVSLLLRTGDAECNSPYEITTTGDSGDADPPVPELATEGVPWLLDLDETKSFQLETGVSARLLLAPSAIIPASGTDYIEVEFAVTGSDTVVNIRYGTDEGFTSQTFQNLVSSSSYTDFSVTVNVEAKSIQVSKDGSEIATHVRTGSFPDVKFILVQTQTIVDSDTSHWKFCEDILMMLDPSDDTDNDDITDGDDTTTCATSTSATNWVRLEIDGIYEVKVVLLRGSSALGDAEIKIGTCDDTTGADDAGSRSIIDQNSLCGTVETTEAGSATSWIFKECSITGHFVYIIVDAGATAFDLCEIEVWGIPSTTAAKITFSEASSSELESVTNRIISVEREGDTSSCVYFNLEEVAGSPDPATKDTDFTFTEADLVVDYPTDPLHAFDADDTDPQLFAITVTDDTDLEPDETFGFRLTELEGAVVGSNPTTTLTIEDNEVCYSWEKITYSFSEDVGTATVVLTRGGYTEAESTACIKTDITTIDPPATAATGDQFTELPTMTEVDFEENDMQTNVEVEIDNDDCYDGTTDKSFEITLEDTCNGEDIIHCDGAGGAKETLITITNDDAIHRFQTVVQEETETDGKVTVVVEREGYTGNASPAIDVQSQVTTASDTATPTDDYIPLDTQVIIPAGLTTTYVEVVIVDDKIVEDNEKLRLVLGSNLAACAVDQSKMSKDITLVDNDCFYSIDKENDEDNSVVKKKVLEGEGTVQLTINCERDDDLQLVHSGYVDVNIEQITGKTAIADEDFESSGANPVRVLFTPGSYTVTGNTGKDTATLSIDIYNDNVVEETLNEVFEVTLDDSSSSEFREPTRAEITITDDDVLISFQEISVSVGESENTITGVLIRQGYQSRQDSVRLISRSVTATSGGDYMSINEIFTFNPGENTGTFELTIFADEDVELDESFIVSIVPLNTEDLIVDPEKDELTVIIKDNNCLFSLEVDDDQLIVNENNQPSSIRVTVRRKGFEDQESSITLKTESFTTPILGRDFATANVDYVSLEEELVFQPGVDERTTTINILNDEVPELSEVFLLSLSDPQCDIDGASRKVITILDDDEILIKMANSEERIREDAGEVVITLVRTGLLTDEDSVSLSVTPTSVGGSKSATPGADYDDRSYTATFEAGSGDVSVSIPIFDDNFQEDPETFVVTIGNILGSDSAAKVTPNEEERKTTVYINDDDDVFNLKESLVIVSESTVSYTTYVERVGTASSLATVYVSTRDGTATSPADYSPLLPVALSFPPGTKSQPVTVDIVNDKIEEPSQNFVLILTSDDGSIIGRSVTSFTIQDDDFPISFKDSDSIVYINEGNPVTITVQRTRADFGRPGEPATVSVLSRRVESDNGAEPGVDFDIVNEQVVFSSFATEVDITVTVKDDEQGEEQEVFELYLSDPSPSNTHYITYPNVLTVYIRDDDGGSDGGEGDDGTGDGGTTRLSKTAIVLIGGVFGLVILLAILGLIGLYAFSKLGTGAAAAAPASNAALHYPQRPQPRQFGAQSRTNGYAGSYNQGFRI